MSPNWSLDVISTRFSFLKEKAVLLFAYLFVVADFPTTFLPTAILDLAWTMIYIVLTLISDQVRFRDLFLPYREDN
jgi:hypothetical protein